MTVFVRLLHPYLAFVLIILHLGNEKLYPKYNQNDKDAYIYVAFIDISEENGTHCRVIRIIGDYCGCQNLI
jgi:hypothetical protein